jgi:hypothetical protein
LEINVPKTQLILDALSVAHPTEICATIERVENFLFLGSLILNTTEDIRRYIRRASHQTGVLQNVWKLLCSEPLRFVFSVLSLTLSFSMPVKLGLPPELT